MSRGGQAAQWAVVPIGDVCEIVTGKTPSKKNPQNFGGDIPFVKPGDLGNEDVIFSSVETLSDVGAISATVLPEGSVLVTCIGNLGKSGILGRSAAFNQQINGIVPSAKVDPRYLFYWVRTIKPWMEENASATTVTILNKGRFAKAPFPLIPLSDQQRIVAKLDRLFKRSKKSKEALDAIPGLLDRYRQSVLAAACSGRLTADWRKAHPDVEPASVLLERIRVERRRRWEEDQLAQMKAKGKTPKNDKWKAKYQEPEPVDTTGLPELPDGWLWCSLSEVSQRALGKMLDRGKQNFGRGLPYLRNQNVRWGEFDLFDLKSMCFREAEIERFSVRAGDVVVCEGGEPGRCAVWRRDPVRFQKALHRVRPYSLLLSDYLVVCLRRDALLGRLAEYFTGTTIKHLTGRSLGRYVFPLPPMAEQREIVLAVGALLRHSQSVSFASAEVGGRLQTLEDSTMNRVFAVGKWLIG